MNKQDINELSLYLKALPRLADTDRPARIEASKADFWTFITTYFPHHVEHAEQDRSRFRQFVHRDLYELSKTHKKLLFTAYRGAAKTTVITKLFTLWLMVKGDFRFAVIISSTDTLAGLIFEFYKTELEDNASLRQDFNITLPGIWRETELVVDVDGHLCKLMGFGAGKKLRGVHFLSYRPDLLLLDDVENDEQVQSLHQRNKLENWFKKAVMKLPSRKAFYRLIVVGTILHNDSLLKRLEQRRDFQAYNFPLVLQFPHNMDSEDDEPDLTGLVLDDPDIDGTEVMDEYCVDKDAFLSEYQNQPISQDGLLFDGYQTFERMPKCDIYWMGLDPSMGKKTGDYFAVAVLGKKDQQFYATVKGYRMSPVKLIGRIIATYARYSKIAPTTLAVETVQFQEFFKDVLKKEAAAIDVPLSVKELRNTAPKPLRIDSIAPLINDGTIQIHQADTLLIEELDTYPSAAHDDLLDALEMAYRIYRHGGQINYKTVREKLAKKGFKRLKRKYA